MGRMRYCPRNFFEQLTKPIKISVTLTGFLSEKSDSVEFQHGLYLNWKFVVPFNFVITTLSEIRLYMTINKYWPVVELRIARENPAPYVFVY
jgi:hypothetical protein